MGNWELMQLDAQGLASPRGLRVSNSMHEHRSSSHEKIQTDTARHQSSTSSIATCERRGANEAMTAGCICKPMAWQIIAGVLKCFV